VVLEPTLQAIADFLAGHHEMVEAIRPDLQRGLKDPATRRTSELREPKGFPTPSAPTTVSWTQGA
jgi:hypothetical protein